MNVLIIKGIGENKGESEGESEGDNTYNNTECVYIRNR